MGLKDKNALMVAAVAALVAGAPFATGCKSEKEKEAAHATSTATEKHACKGMNACKSMGGCSTGDNGCAGKNSCKGHGGCAVPVKH